MFVINLKQLCDALNVIVQTDYELVKVSPDYETETVTFSAYMERCILHIPIKAESLKDTPAFEMTWHQTFDVFNAVTQLECDSVQFVLLKGKLTYKLDIRHVDNQTRVLGLNFIKSIRYEVDPWHEITPLAYVDGDSLAELCGYASKNTQQLFLEITLDHLAATYHADGQKVIVASLDASTPPKPLQFPIYSQVLSCLRIVSFVDKVAFHHDWRKFVLAGKAKDGVFCAVSWY